jgi:hypothetical protein
MYSNENQDEKDPTIENFINILELKLKNLDPQSTKSTLINYYKKLSISTNTFLDEKKIE